MAYPAQDELLNADPLLDWIDENFLRPDPYAFRESSFRPVISLLSREFGLDANGIFSIGSAAVGLSINPTKIEHGLLKPLDDASDLDLALISEVHFETAWRDLRQASQPMGEMDGEVRKHLTWQRKRFFDGAILAHKLLPALSFGPTWISSQVRLAEVVSVQLGREIDVNFWIFRDYWSLQNYVARSIVDCQRVVR